MKLRYSEADHPKAYSTVHPLVEIYGRIAHDLEIVGRHNVPRLGGAIISMSHRDAYDGVAAGAAVQRPLFIMAKKEMWEEGYDFNIPVINKTGNAGRIAGYFGAFPVDRDDPGRETLEHSYKLIDEGKLLGVFPEGSRYEDEVNKIVRGRQLGELLNGTGLIAVKKDVPIVPMGLRVRREISKKGKKKIAKVAVVINEPIKPVVDPEMPRKLIIARTMAEVRESLQDAHDQAYDLAA